MTRYVLQRCSCSQSLRPKTLSAHLRVIGVANRSGARGHDAQTFFPVTQTRSHPILMNMYSRRWIGLVTASLACALSSSCIAQVEPGPSNNSFGQQDSSSSIKQVPLPVPERHIPTPVRCNEVPDPGPFDPNIDGDCKSDADCKEGMGARCGLHHPEAKMLYCLSNECMDSSDCPAGHACVCELEPYQGDRRFNRCLASQCISDRDCGPQGYCSPSLGFCGTTGRIKGYFCRTPNDKCVNHSDCGKGFCIYKTDHWACSYTKCG